MVGPRNGFVKGFRGPAAYLEGGGFTGDGPAGGKRPFSAGLAGSPASAPGTGCSPGNPLCAGAESPKPAPQRASGSPVQPCGLVCEVMARRSSRTGRGLVGLGLCSAFPARPQVPVDRGPGHAQEPCDVGSAHVLEQVLLVGPGPGDGGLDPGWSTAVTVPCTLTTAPVSTEWRSTAARAPAVRPPESSGLSMMKRDPSWVIWVI